MKVNGSPYDSTYVYAAGDTVTFAGTSYTSLLGSNLGHTPGSPSVFWSSGPSYPATATYPGTSVSVPTPTYPPASYPNASVVYANPANPTNHELHSLKLVTLTSDVQAIKDQLTAIWRALGGASRIV